VTEQPTPSAPAPRGVGLQLALIAAVASIGLTAAAFWLSYEHLHDVAHAHGLADAARSWAWPATVDMFILIGEVLMLRGSLAGRIDPWSIALTSIGSAGSIALNVAGVGAGAGLMNYVVAAVPPVAALLAFGALMRQIHGALAGRIATEEEATDEVPLTASLAPAEDFQGDHDQLPTPPLVAPPAQAEPATDESAVAPQEDATPRHSAPATDATDTPQRGATERPQSAAPKAPRKALRRNAPAGKRGAAKEAIRTLYDSLGRRPLESEMVAELVRVKSPHTSRQFANKIRAEIEEDQPELAALGSDNVRPLTGS
jgi:hypothetical protein